jgi:putative PIN family toxin of toxin-antitoxin system
MRIVLDTNSLIQSIPEKSPYYGVWLSILRGENTLCVSNEILEEYGEILQRLAGYQTAEYVLDAITKSKHVEMISPYYHFGLISTDPDDNKFVDCAIAANARYIVTNDKHYDVLRQTKFPVVDVISLREFLLCIRNSLD